MSTNKVGAPLASVGLVTDVDSSQRNPLGMKVVDDAGNVYIYLLGIASTAIGSWVTYDETGATALLAANAVGPVAVAMGAIVASKYGWYCIKSDEGVSALMAANSADNSANLGRETTDGYAGDGRAAGDMIVGAVARGATGGVAALTTVQLNYPFVTDALGS